MVAPLEIRLRDIVRCEPLGTSLVGAGCVCLGLIVSLGFGPGLVAARAAVTGELVLAVVLFVIGIRRCSRSLLDLRWRYWLEHRSHDSISNRVYELCVRMDRKIAGIWVTPADGVRGFGVRLSPGNVVVLSANVEEFFSPLELDVVLAQAITFNTVKYPMLFACAPLGQSLGRLISFLWLPDQNRGLQNLVVFALTLAVFLLIVILIPVDAYRSYSRLVKFIGNRAAVFQSIRRWEGMFQRESRWSRWVINRAADRLGLP